MFISLSHTYTFSLSFIIFVFMVVVVVVVLLIATIPSANLINYDLVWCVFKLSIEMHAIANL